MKKENFKCSYGRCIVHRLTCRMWRWQRSFHRRFSSCNNVATATDDNTLTVWCWDPAFNINAMNEAAKVYQKDHPDFKLNVVETPWADLQTKLNTAGVAGDLSTLPDIFLMQDNAFWKNQISFPDVFANLTETKAFDFTQFAPGKLAYSTVNGVNYGVPFDNGTVIAAYRTDILEQAGYYCSRSYRYRLGQIYRDR